MTNSLLVFAFFTAAASRHHCLAAFISGRSPSFCFAPGAGIRANTARSLSEQAESPSQETDESTSVPPNEEDMPDRVRYFLGTSGFRTAMPDDERRAATEAVAEAEEVDRKLLLEDRARLEEMWMPKEEVEELGGDDVPAREEELSSAKGGTEEVMPVDRAVEEAEAAGEAKAEVDAKKLEEEEAERKRTEEEENARAEAEAEAKAEAEARAAAESKRKADEEAEAARRALEEEEARRKAEEEEKAEAEAEAEARKKREEEEAARKAAEEEEARLRAEEEAAARKEAEEEAARAAAEAEARKLRAEEDSKLIPLKDRATGIEFQPKLGELYLLGVGVRKKAIINVYSVGVYSSYDTKQTLSSLSAKSDRKAALATLRSAAQSSSTTFLLQMAFKAGADAMASAIAESVAPRHDGDKGDVEELKTLIFDGVKAKGGTATKGTTFLFECLPGEGVGVSVDGNGVGTVQSESLGAAFCDVFLDDKAVSPPLRDNCLQNCCGA